MHTVLVISVLAIAYIRFWTIEWNLESFKRIRFCSIRLKHNHVISRNSFPAKGERWISEEQRTEPSRANVINACVKVHFRFPVFQLFSTNVFCFQPYQFWSPGVLHFDSLTKINWYKIWFQGVFCHFSFRLSVSHHHLYRTSPVETSPEEAEKDD